MGEFIVSYERYLNKEKGSVNEGWKTWMATFMMLLNVGFVPPKIKAADIQNQIEWVQSISEEQIALAKFIAMLNRDGNLSPNSPYDKVKIQALLTKFNARNQVSISMTDVLNSSEVKSFTDDNDNTTYKWTMNTKTAESIKLAGVVSKDQVKPATYMNGVSLVSDYGDFMSSEVEKQIHEALYNYEKITGVEIAILTIPTFGDEDPNDYATTVFNRWGIGKKRGNNGILVVTSMGDRQWWIATGYGMEDIFTDARCRQFGERYLVPNFKNGDYEKGFTELVSAMKQEFGDIPIERKKENDRLAAIERKEDFKNFFYNALGFIGMAAVMGLIGYFIYYGIRKRKLLLRKIADIKTELENFDTHVKLLIDEGDPIFDDDKILSELKKTGEALKARKLKNSKNIEGIINELNVIINQLNSIKAIEQEIKKIHVNVQGFQQKFVSMENQPTDLIKASMIAQAAFKVMNFEKIDVSNKTRQEFVGMFNEARSFYENFNTMKKKVEDIHFKTKEFEKTRLYLNDKLEKARKTADIVKEMGHETQINIGENEIEALRTLITTVGDIYMTDLRSAYDILKQYDKATSDINAELEKPVKKYNDIMTAKKFVDRSDKEITIRMEEIKKYIHSNDLTDTDRNRAIKLAEDFEKKKNNPKNSANDLYDDGWVEPGEENVGMSQILVIAAALTSLLSTLDALILKGKRSQEDKEKKRLAIARKKREEAEEADRRRRNSYSSSSSSGGFSGFGGGSSGGGGAGGRW